MERVAMAKLKKYNCDENLSKSCQFGDLCLAFMCQAVQLCLWFF